MKYKLFVEWSPDSNNFWTEFEIKKYFFHLQLSEDLMFVKDKIGPFTCNKSDNFSVDMEFHGMQTAKISGFGGILKNEPWCEAEAQFEAALQLALVATIFLASGRWTTRSILSGTTSILVIGRVGVQNFFNGQEKELAKASLLGKICVAISVLPVFVLTAFFKIGSFAVVKAWNAAGIEEIVLALLALVPPALVLLLLKVRLPLKDLTAATISQGLVAELVSLHLWRTCEPLGRKIGLAMTSFIFLLLSSFLAWILIQIGRV